MDMPAPRPDGCGDSGDVVDGGGQEACEAGGGEAGGREGLVRLPSATHRVQAPGSMTPAYVSNRLGR
jgi:hypothetical protein